MPDIDLTEILDDCGDFVEFTQPYFMIHKAYEDILLLYVTMQALFSIKDERWHVAERKYERARQRIKWSMSVRGSLDRTPRLEDPDAHILSRNRSNRLGNYAGWPWRY